MPCRSCGREGYSDICSECMFREQNQQCWRCRMYIPNAEMQQWRGQWICPNCRMDLEREEGGPGREKKKKEEEGGQADMYEKPGRCDQCGRETIILYRFNHRNLCWYCLEKEDTYAGAGGTGGAIPVQLSRQVRKKKGVLGRIKEYFFGKGAEEEAEVEISVARVIPIRRKGREGEVVPVKKGENAEIVPRKSEQAKEEHKEGHQEKKEEKKEEKRERGPLVEKEKGEPPKEEKKDGKEGKKKPEWGTWKKD
ncbi:hypothetical protein H0O01_03455 [Candidatus Micrarchaeota archaeon]|nr:hypothetical protein [Candidatus Micrarchaeota archaeon]